MAASALTRDPNEELEVFKGVTPNIFILYKVDMVQMLLMSASYVNYASLRFKTYGESTVRDWKSKMINAIFKDWKLSVGKF